MFKRRIFFPFLISILALFLFNIPVFADSCTVVAECVSQNLTCSQCVDYLSSKINEKRSQEKSLSSEISAMDNQIKLTEARIENTQEEIDVLLKDIDITKGKVNGLEKDIGGTTKALLGRIAAVYEVGRADPFQIFLTSSDINSFMTRLKYLRIVQIFDKKTVYAAEQSKVNYSNQQDILEQKQKEAEALNEQLQSYTKQLDSNKQSKQVLLSDTQGSEANYQRLLNQARAQLEGFTKFTQSQGGASLLSNQTKCDDWGCYYSQRDSSWGGNSLNGTGYTLASDGCLVTSMAMVYTHYGHRDVNPTTINSNSSNFASYYPAYLKYQISANGVSSSRVGASIDSSLANGDPVVVGVHAYGGTHFVVLKSGSNGNYIMHDPYIANGSNINFSDHYSVSSIFEVNRVAF